MQHREYIEKQAQHLLMKLGITANYKGFHYISYAMYLIFEEPSRLLYVSKLLYPEIAQEFHTDWRSVEHNMRTVIRHIWKENADVLCRMTGYNFSRRPAAGVFLSICYTVLYDR